MWDSDAACKTIQDVNNRLKTLQYKKDMLEMLKDNIRIRVIGFGWTQFKCQWSKNGIQKLIQELQQHLKTIIRAEKHLDIAERPSIPIPHRMATPILGQLTTQVKKLDKRAKDEEGSFDQSAREKWKRNELEGLGNMNRYMQQKDSPAINDSLIGTRIEYLSEFDMDDEGTVKELRWCGGVVKRICDGTRGIPGKQRKRYKKGEPVEIFWDAISEADIPPLTSIVPLNPRNWNKDVVEGWRKDIGDITYGLKL